MIGEMKSLKEITFKEMEKSLVKINDGDTSWPISFSAFTLDNIQSVVPSVSLSPEALFQGYIMDSHQHMAKLKRALEKAPRHKSPFGPTGVTFSEGPGRGERPV